MPRTDLERWQSITEDAKEQQHADAIAIDAAVDQRELRKHGGFDVSGHYVHCEHCKCFACRDTRAAR